MRCPNRHQREDRGQQSGHSAICGLVQPGAAGVRGGPSSTVGTYSNSWSPPSKTKATEQPGSRHRGYVASAESVDSLLRRVRRTSQPGSGAPL